MNLILTKRRLKKWAANKGIEWMDGMPLTLGLLPFHIGNHKKAQANARDPS